MTVKSKMTAFDNVRPGRELMLYHVMLPRLFREIPKYWEPDWNTVSMLREQGPCLYCRVEDVSTGVTVGPRLAE